MSNYDVSVLIPIYNAENTIIRCIDSVLAQTKDRIEIVAVDDGSTDSTPQILEDYRKSHSNVVVIHQENQGLAGARITGLKNATGEYIGWLDADDFVEPDMYSTLYDLAKRNAADLVYCDYNFFPEQIPSKAKWYKPYNGKKDWNFIDRNTQCWNKLMKKSIVDEVRLAELFEEFGEYSPISVMLKAEKIISCDKKLYNYRVGHESMSGGTYIGKLEKFREGAAMSSKLYKLLAGTQYERELREYFQYRYIYTLLQLEIVAAVNHNKRMYQFAGRKLRSLNYNANKYTKVILDNNHGVLKSFVLRRLIPQSYLAALAVTRAVF